VSPTDELSALRSTPSSLPPFRPAALPVVAALALTLSVAPAAARAAEATPGAAVTHPDLSGVWVLDQDMTRKSMESSRGSRGGFGGMGRGGGRGGGGEGGGWGGGGGRHGGGWGGRGGDDDGDQPGDDSGSGSGGDWGGGHGGERGDAMRSRGQALQRIEIHQTDQALTLTLGDGTTQSFATDGKKHDVDTPAGKAEIQARWTKGGELEVRTKADRRKRTETYLVTDDRKLLTVTVEMSGSRGDMTFHRYYRPEPAPPDATTSPAGPAPPPSSAPPPA
jgi:hypothetical protein